jgi:hypothetical protein
LDHADKQAGDLSLIYRPGQAKGAKKVGFLANLWNGTWSLSKEQALKLHLKTTGAENPVQWRTVLVDDAGKTAAGMLGGTDTKGQWRALTLPLAALKADEGFNWNAVRLCEFEADFGKDAEVRFDGVCFEGKGAFIGITDKPISQRMAEAESNRAFRMAHAIRVGASGGVSKAVQAFNKMLLNEDLETANQWLAEDLTKMLDEDTWSLLSTPLYCRFYFCFSSRAGTFPGRLKPEVERQLLDCIWQRTYLKNDMAWSRQSTWWLDGSENHDLNSRACNLVSSRIFMNEPEYKDRIYPDYGFGGAYHYGPSGYLGKDVDIASRHAGGRANLKDGHAYKAADHYEAWLAYLKNYFLERARRGFFLENWSNVYTKHTYNMIELARQYGGDDELKKIINDFLTLYWADWAQKEISGVHGGPKTRHKGVGGYDSSTSVIMPHLGGPASGDIWHYWNLVSDFRLPKVVWEMALDREGMGVFAYQSRGIGEEQNLWPRPLGTERSLICDTESRILKYTYVTPDYTLGSQMDRPALAQSHLSIANRWQGMTFAQSAASRIVPVSFPETELAHPKPDTAHMFACFQHKDVLLCQPARSYLRISPTWFPGGGNLNAPRTVIAVYVGTEWDRQIEKDGWVFVQKGNAYAAIRPVLWDKAFEEAKAGKAGGTQIYFNSPKDAATARLRLDSYRWSADKSLMELEDAYSPILIQAGRKADYPTLEAFMTDVLDNPLALYNTVVPGYNILVYTGNGKGAPLLVYNAGTADVPTIVAKPVNYSYPMTFDSPYLKSDYKSGKIRIRYGDNKLNLDFAGKPWWMFW